MMNVLYGICLIIWEVNNMNTETFYKYTITTGVNTRGLPDVIVTNNKAVKHSVVCGWCFKTEEQREAWITRFKAGVESKEAYKFERRQARKSFVNPAKVGDILYSSWGYDQTNIDFYQVIEVRGKMVVIQSIGSEVTEYTGLDQWTVMPRKDSFRGEPMRKLVQRPYDGNGYYLHLESYSSAYLWDGQPKHASGGH